MHSSAPKRAPPRTAPPISTEEMTVIKKRVAPPKGPPPQVMLEGFRPKSMMSSSRDNGYGRSGDNGRDSVRYMGGGDYGNGSTQRRGSPPRGRHDYPYDDYYDGYGKTDRKPARRDSRERESKTSFDRRERDDQYDSRDSRDSRDRYPSQSDSPDSFSDKKYSDKEKKKHAMSDEKDSSKDSKHENNEVALRYARNGRDKIFNFRKTVLGAKYKELRTFVKTPIRAGVVVRCYIERSRGIGKNFLSPCYSLCADMEDGSGKELISCRKILKSKTSHYVFSMRPDDLYRKRDERSRVYLGKLRSISSSEYVMYDSGSNTRTDMLDPDTIESEEDDEQCTEENDEPINSAVDDALYKSQLCSIYYHAKTRPTSGLGMEVCVPAVPSRTKPVQGDLRTDLVKCFDKIRQEGKQNELYQNKCFVMQEKKSRYDPLSSCLVDYQGRATIASVKNFQLLESTPFYKGERPEHDKSIDDEIIFQMGKLSDDCFNMDFMYPLSMLQAFAIAISRFDAKVSW